MEYLVSLDNFDGPLDLLLHLIKQSDLNIVDISLDSIAKQYLEYIEAMEELNLNIASEYLVMAAELIEMKSNVLLPRKKQESDDEFEEDPREKLINRLLEYQKYKEVSQELKELETKRKDFFTKEPESLNEFKQNMIETDINIDMLMDALNNFLKRKELDKPLNTKIATKEYSVSVRSNEIHNILKKKKKVKFEELFDVYSKDYVVVTFLSILNLAKKQEINIIQDNNFKEIIIESKLGDK